MMQVKVLIKCPHDKQAEVQTIDGLPTGVGEFVTHPEKVTFDCDRCRDYSQGYLDFKNHGQPILRNTPDPRVKLADNPQA